MFVIGQKCVFTYLIKNASEYKELDGKECIVNSKPIKDSDDRIYYKVLFEGKDERWAYENELQIVKYQVDAAMFRLIDGINQITYI